MQQTIVTPLRRSWAPVGQTPMLWTSLNHHAHYNLLRALIVSPHGQHFRLMVHSTEKNINSQPVIVTLQQLLCRIRSPITLVWDNAPTHDSHATRAFLAAHPRVVVFEFPKYAPELNPVEFLWAQCCEHIAGQAPVTIPALRKLVHAALQRARASQWRLRSCLKGCELK